MPDPREAVSQAESVAGHAWGKPPASESERLHEILDASMGSRPTQPGFFLVGPASSGWLDPLRQSRMGPHPTGSPEIAPIGLDLQLAQIERQVAGIDERLARLESTVAELEVLAEETLTPAELSTLPGLELRRPIPIVIEESATDAVARWIEPGLAGIGGSEGEAIESLREEVLTVWHDLDTAADSELTRNTRTMRSILRSYVQSAS